MSFFWSISCKGCWLSGSVRKIKLLFEHVTSALFDTENTSCENVASNSFWMPRLLWRRKRVQCHWTDVLPGIKPGVGFDKVELGACGFCQKSLQYHVSSRKEHRKMWPHLCCIKTPACIHFRPIVIIFAQKWWNVCDWAWQALTLFAAKFKHLSFGHWKQKCLKRFTYLFESSGRCLRQISTFWISKLRRPYLLQA